MYLAPWQIFAGGCVCGALITLIVLIAIVVGIVKRSGVKVKHVDGDDDNE